MCDGKAGQGQASCDTFRGRLLLHTRRVFLVHVKVEKAALARVVVVLFPARPLDLRMRARQRLRGRWKEVRF